MNPIKIVIHADDGMLASKAMRHMNQLAAITDMEMSQNRVSDGVEIIITGSISMALEDLKHRLESKHFTIKSIE